jgi:hypothetical protein
MGHQHFQTLALPAAEQRAPVQQPPVIAIADDALERFEGGDLRLRVQSAPEVPGMPDLVDIPEELLELRRKHTVRIRYESDKHGPAKIANVDFCPKRFPPLGTESHHSLSLNKLRKPCRKYDIASLAIIRGICLISYIFATDRRF